MFRRLVQIAIDGLDRSEKRFILLSSLVGCITKDMMDDEYYIKLNEKIGISTDPLATKFGAVIGGYLLRDAGSDCLHLMDEANCLNCPDLLESCSIRICDMLPEYLKYDTPKVMISDTRRILEFNLTRH